MLAFPIVIALLYICILIGHIVKAATTHNDLNDISNEYMEKSRCGFWVAESLDDFPLKSSASDSKVKIIREDQMNLSEVERALSGNRKRLIIGTVAITIKNDPDLREPPQSVAWLRRMSVKKSYRRCGIGAALTNVALDHCSMSNFRAVELLTTEHHQAARNLYAKKGFELIETKRKSFVCGLLGFSLYRLRVPCVITRLHLNA